MGNQKLKPRNSSVADSATGSGTPTACSINTELASKLPRPPGKMPMVRNRFEIMKPANTPTGDAEVPKALTRIHTVVASSRTMHN
jgi:hypothetical protein